MIDKEFKKGYKKGYKKGMDDALKALKHQIPKLRCYYNLVTKRIEFRLIK